MTIGGSNSSGSISTTGGPVTITGGKENQTSVEVTTETPEDQTKAKARSLIKFMKRVASAAQLCIKKANQDSNEVQYFRGSIDVKDLGTKKNVPQVCSFEDSCVWVTEAKGSGYDIDNMVRNWNTSEQKKASNPSAVRPYEVTPVSEKTEVTSIQGRAPDKVTFKPPVEGTYEKMTQKGTTQNVSGFSYDIQEQYPPSFNDGQNNLILHYTLITDDNDEVLSLAYPNGVTTYFVFEEAGEENTNENQSNQVENNG